MLWALSENAPNENAPNDRQIFRTQTELSEFMVSTSGLDGPFDLMWGLTALLLEETGDANQQCKYDTKGRLTENSERGQEAETSGPQLVGGLLCGAEPLDKCNHFRMLSG